MKANRAARAHRARLADEQAVSSVVAAVLLFALFTTAFTIWTFTTLPQWVADREQAHADKVQQSFSALQAGLDALSASDDNGPSSVAVDLGPSPIALLQPTAAQGELSVQGEVRATGTFVNEQVPVVVPSPIDDIDEGAGDVFDDVAVLEGLVVRLQTSGVGNGQRAWAQAVASDGSSTVTAVLTHAGKTSGSGPNVAGCLNTELRLQVTVDIDPNPPVTTTQALLCELADDLTGYTIDLASDLFTFADGVERLGVPYTLTLTDDSTGGVATGTFGVKYRDPFDREVGTALQATEFEFDETGPRLVYAPAYQEFTGPGVAWEFGGIVLEQGDGSALHQGPSFDVVVANGVGHLNWTLVTMRGSGDQVGSGPVTAVLRHGQTRDVELTAEGATFTLTTPDASAWRAYFADQVLLGDATGEAVVAGTGTTASLTIGSGTVDQWIIHLRLVTASVDVR